MEIDLARSFQGVQIGYIKVWLYGEVGSIVIATAISHKPHQEVLRDCGILARDLLEALPAALYLTDATGRLTFYNRAAADLWGWCRIWGAPGGAVPGGCSGPTGRPAPRPVPDGGGDPAEPAGARRGAQAERPDGARVPFAPYPTPLRDPDGELLGAVNLLMAISDDCNSEVARRGGPSPQWVRREAEHRANNLLLAILPIASRLRADTAVPRRHPSGRARALALQLMEESGFGIEPACSRAAGAWVGGSRSDRVAPLGHRKPWAVGHSPWKTGRRFSLKARIPSR